MTHLFAREKGQPLGLSLKTCQNDDCCAVEGWTDELCPKLSKWNDTTKPQETQSVYNPNKPLDIGA